jgi:LemA protein
MIILGVVATVLVLTIGAAVVKIYNRLVAMKGNCENGFSQIEVQLKRRYDLIPNLVNCVKSYLQHEAKTLEAVIAARNQAASGLTQVAKNPSNESAMQSWMGAEGMLAGALGRMSFVIESYPELKGSERVAHLMEELTSTENKISFARQLYNDWAAEFNIYRQSFPAVCFAASFGFADNLKMIEFENQADLEQSPEVMLTA